jgi:4-hydroxythreonine-4-phosphate dehydrogenase
VKRAPAYPRVGVAIGDPAGIGPEIVLKAAASQRVTRAARLVIIGDARWLERQAKRLKLRWPLQRRTVELVDLANVEPHCVAGSVSAGAGRAAVETIERATELALSGGVDAIATAPIHKEAIAAAGYVDAGHTEMLQRLTGAKQVGMLFWSKSFSVGLLTRHLALREALRAVRANRIVQAVRLFDAGWRQLLGKTPRIAVAGLNPHASEGGRFGHEEQREIAPAIERLQQLGLSVSGPYPPDSIFNRAQAGEFDLVLALYHDQGTIPIKLVCGYDAVNITVGLPFVRTSPDHGTAMEIAGKGIASGRGMEQAILAAARFARRQRSS